MTTTENKKTTTATTPSSNNINNDNGKGNDNEETTAASKSSSISTGTIKCHGCSKEFPSRNQIFKHLRDTSGACLNPTDYKHFLQYVKQKDNRIKVLVLYGYIPSQKFLVMNPPADGDGDDDDTTGGGDCCSLKTSKTTTTIRNGEDAAQFVVNILEAQQTQQQNSSAAANNGSSNISNNNNNKEDGVLETGVVGRGGRGSRASGGSNDNNNNDNNNKINRSYGHLSRSSDAVIQDDYTSALTEVMAIRLPPLDKSKINEWIDQTNDTINKQLSDGASAQIRILGRFDIKHKKFNAEKDVSHRRIEYIMPADFLLSPLVDEKERQEFFNSLNEFSADSNPFIKNRPELGRPNKESLDFLYKLKKTMQKLATHIERLDLKDETAVMEKEFHEKKRKRNKHSQNEKQQAQKRAINNNNKKEKQQRRNDNNNSDAKTDTFTSTHIDGRRRSQDNDGEEKEEASAAAAAKESQQSCEESTKNNNNNNNSTKEDNGETITKTTSKTTKNVLRRKRYHNFTPRLMAHEFLSYRRLDRIYHCSTFKILNDNTSSNNTQSRRPFVSISLTGDLFLNGQVCRVIGLLIALIRSSHSQSHNQSNGNGNSPIILLDDPDLFIDCIFDEEYPHLIPTPPMPSLGMVSCEASYNSWEGKVKAILCPRKCNLYKDNDGWNDDKTLRRIADWHNVLYQHIAKSWLLDGNDNDKNTTGSSSNNNGQQQQNRLRSEELWTKQVLEPWTINANKQLLEYRKWKEQQQQQQQKETVASATATATTTATTLEEEEEEEEEKKQQDDDDDNDLLVNNNNNNDTTKDISTRSNDAANGDSSSLTTTKPLTTSSSTTLEESIDSSVPQIYEKVLYYLRQADESGLWPTTTPKRQLVMVSTTTTTNNNAQSSTTIVDDGDSNNRKKKKTDDEEASTTTGAAASSTTSNNNTKTSLSMAHMIAKSNKLKLPKEEQGQEQQQGGHHHNRTSAYDFVEGYGGASGSFSVGAMPDEQCSQPKGNMLFPELMKSAFELERVLCPDREPSSMIAINRNAQFRPHTDSGAGAGQSTSLIVGLGTYGGGELMVEGDKHDIRYKPIEFNGWKQRHWTMPFIGERYSLVWFTPKGCEGIHGIDLCK